MSGSKGKGRFFSSFSFLLVRFAQTTKEGNGSQGIPVGTFQFGLVLSDLEAHLPFPSGLFALSNLAGGFE